jgi:hypothetical protein
LRLDSFLVEREKEYKLRKKVDDQKLVFSTRNPNEEIISQSFEIQVTNKFKQ